MRVVVDEGRRWRRVLTLVCVVALVLPSAGGASAGPREDLDQVRRQIDKARGDLGGINDRRAATTRELERSQARQAELHEGLQALNAELGAAQASLADADARLRETAAELAATEQRLQDTRAELGAVRDQFAQRARASYMYGGRGPGATSAVFVVDDVNRFGQALSYMQRVMEHDRQQVDLAASLEREVQAAATELAFLRERRAEDRQAAAVERDRVAGLHDQQRSLHDRVAAESEAHQRLLAELDEDRATHVALIDSLESESAALEDELRRRAEEQRRRAEEARRVAAAEARRQADQRAARSRVAEVAPPAGPTSSGWHRPSAGRVSSGYGWRHHPIYGTSRMHTGVDFASPAGSPIYAVTDGVVVSAGWRGGYGLAVVVDHGGGVATLYAHTSGVNVAPGQRVSRGQVLAATGCTGTCTGPHLHFEVRVNGQHRNPMAYL